MERKNDATGELRSLLREALTPLEKNIDQALRKGWHLPKQLGEKLLNSPRPAEEDLEEWINKLFETFSAEANLPGNCSTWVE